MKKFYYSDYLEAVSNGFEKKNSNFQTIVVSETYIPDPSHQPIDITDHILTKGHFLEGICLAGMPDEMVSSFTMTLFRDSIIEDLENAKQKARKIFKNHKDKEDKLLGLIDKASDKKQNTLSWWKEIKDAGAKYLIVQSTGENILCSCEEIE